MAVRPHPPFPPVPKCFSWLLIPALLGLIAGMTHEQLQVKMVLVNPAGEEILFPAYNAEVQNVEVKIKY